MDMLVFPRVKPIPTHPSRPDRAYVHTYLRAQMSQWLVDIREVSYKMGGAAMRRYTKIQGASTESGAGLEGDGGGTRSQVSRLVPIVVRTRLLVVLCPFLEKVMHDVSGSPLAFTGLRCSQHQQVVPPSMPR